VRFWANKYKTKFNEDPTVFSVYGYTIIDTFAKAAAKSGKNLTTDSFIKVMDSFVIEPDMFGSARQTFTATKRLGSDASRLSQIVDGKWKAIGPYITEEGAAPAKAEAAKPAAKAAPAAKPAAKAASK